MSEFRELGELVTKLRRFMINYSYSVPFFTFSMILAGYWLVVLPIGVLKGVWSLLTIAFILVLMATMMINMMTLPGRIDPNEGIKWMASFSIPFIAGYLLASIIDPARLYPIIWYLCLAISSLLAHLLIERVYFKKGALVFRPYLMSSILHLATFPLIVYMAYRIDPNLAPLQALGLTLLIQYASGMTTLYKTSKSLFQGGS